MKERSSSSSGGGGSSSSKLTLVSIHERCITFLIQDLWGCKGFPLQTGSCSVQVTFNEGFTLHEMLLLFVMHLCTSCSSPL
jgi:hypothetical protein